MSRTNIDIDDELMAAAMEATGQRTKKGTVEEALRAMVKEERLRQAIKNLAGIGWEGNLDEMRRSRHFAEDGTVFHDDDEK